MSFYNKIVCWALYVVFAVCIKVVFCAMTVAPPPFFIFSHNKLFLQYFSDISHCIRFYIVFDHIFIVYADLLKFVMFDLLYFLVKLSILYHSILSLLYQSLLAPFYALINSLILVHIVYFCLGFIVEKFLLHSYWSCI